MNAAEFKALGWPFASACEDLFARERAAGRDRHEAFGNVRAHVGARLREKLDGPKVSASDAREICRLQRVVDDTHNPFADEYIAALQGEKR